jgi:hypothetical protein
MYLLLEAPKLGVKFGGHEETGTLIGDHEIDHATDRAPDGHFREPRPSRMEDAKHRLDHRRLNTVAQRWPGCWKEAERRISSERTCQRDDDREAWLRPSSLNLGEIRLGDTGSCRNLPLAEASVLSRGAVALADGANDRASAPLCFLLQSCRPRRRHPRIELARAYLTLSWAVRLISARWRR